jgi:glycosyltransferase involved in cell wall biosynthesis
MTAQNNFMDISKAKVAWLVPSASSGGHYGPILTKLSAWFEKSIFFTGRAWPDYNKVPLKNAEIKIVGHTKVVSLSQNQGYGRNLVFASPTIIPELVSYRPHIIIANGFSIWTMICLLLKPFFRWKVIVLFDGISPSTSFTDSKVRLLVRRLMSEAIDAFVTNTRAASDYCSEVLNIGRDRILYKTYIVPSAHALSDLDTALEANLAVETKDLKILYVGQLISRKGVQQLVEACSILTAKGLTNYSLTIVGDGEEKAALEAAASQWGIDHQVIFTGWLDYSEIGKYFKSADAFVLPTFEDTWGAVVLEAMAFGAPVVCSKLAGASEVVIEGRNGFVFDPHNANELAEKLAMLLESKYLVESMSEQAKKTAAEHSLEDVAEFFAELSGRLLSASRR